MKARLRRRGDDRCAGDVGTRRAGARRPLGRVGAAAAAALSIAGCFSERPEEPLDPGDGEPVRISSFAFQPAALTVQVGTPIVWTNDDQVLHTVIAEDGSFDSSTFGEGRSFRFVTDEVGTFPYFCGIHPFMSGTLTVRE